MYPNPRTPTSFLNFSASKLAALYFPIIILVFIISACQKEQVRIVWEKIDAPTNGQPLRSIWFANTDTGYIAGGEQYNQQCLLRSIDGGNSWQQLPFVQYEKGLYGLSGTSSKVYLANYDGQIYSSNNYGQTWDMQQTERPDIGWVAIRSICFGSNENGVAVGGYGGGLGTINSTFDGGISWQNQIPPVELRSVCCTGYGSSSPIYFACGYGTIIRSADLGQTWEVLNANGDFFMDISFPTPQIGFVVGYQGKIMKTDDSGNTWQTLRKGSDWLSARPHFNAVVFKDSQKGWIAGNQLVWQTNDGGLSWQVVEELDFEKFYDIYINENNVFVVGEQGVIIRLNVE